MDFILENIKWIFSGVGIIIFSFLIKKYKSFIRPFNIDRVFKSRASTHYLKEILSNAKSNVVLILVTGNFISQVELEECLLTNPYIKFTFILLDPNSESLKKRKADNKKYGKYIVEDHTDNVLFMQKKYPSRIDIKYYDTYPYWHLARVDNNIIYISTNPIHKSGYQESKFYKVKNRGNDIYDMFYDYIEVILNRESIFLKENSKQLFNQINMN